MAKKDKDEQKEASVSGDKDVLSLAKAIIKDLNKDVDAKIAWNLATDFDNPTQVTEFISTQSKLLDFIISNRADGGIPVGKLTEIVGEEASGKSLICAHLIAEVQKRGGIAVYLDTENAASPAFMKQIGVDLGKLVYVQPGTIEEVGENIEKIITNIRSKAPDKLCLIIWDSVAGTPSQSEIEGTYDPNDRIGVTAKALAKMMRKLTRTWGKERIAMVFTNQLKVKIGVTYGDPMTTPGGKAIPYHASCRVRLTRSTEIKNDKEKDTSRGQVMGIRTLAKIIKNRLGPPLRKCEFEIFFDHGIDDVGSWFTYLHEHIGVVEKANGMCFIGGFKHPDPKKNDEEKGRGFKFRESKWSEEVEACPELRQFALDTMEKHLVVTFDGKTPIPDQDLDPESLMDSEAVAGTFS